MTKKRISFALFCVVLCFIWGNSMLSREVSGAISHFIADLFGGSQGASDEGHHFVRKAAHFCEFAALGTMFLLWIKEHAVQMELRLSLCALVGVSVPLIDETIQIFSGRGPALSDVWLDISGYTVGCLVCSLVLFLASGLRKKSKK